MVHAVGARTQGDDYQARMFCLNATRLLLRYSRVVRVVYENPATRYFDDVGVYYSCDIAIERGEYCKSDHFPVKFHVDHSGRFSYESFAEPAFLGAKEMSLLQPVHGFLGEHPDPCRLFIVAPWGVKDGDPLNKLVSNTGGEIRLRKLFTGESSMRRVKEHWTSARGTKSFCEPFKSGSANRSAGTSRLHTSAAFSGRPNDLELVFAHACVSLLSRALSVSQPSTAKVTVLFWQQG